MIIQGENLERVNTFKYLGATLAENGDLDAEMTHRIQSGWKNWKRISGILCDRRISLRVKGKVYKTVVRPAMMYGAETWAVKKAHEKKLDVAEFPPHPTSSRVPGRSTLNVLNYKYKYFPPRKYLSTSTFLFGEMYLSTFRVLSKCT